MYCQLSPLVTHQGTTKKQPAPEVAFHLKEKEQSNLLLLLNSIFQ